MKVIFMGTPDFSCPILSTLHQNFSVSLVVTQPDQPKGRGLHLTSCPVKALASRLGLPVISPINPHTTETLDLLHSITPDVIVVAAYGKILRKSILDLPRLGCVNVHASLLPRWRGASPISAAIEAGDTHTGITTMQMVLAMDAGPILEIQPILIAPSDTTATLSLKLSTLGADMIVSTLEQLSLNQLIPTPQDEKQITFCHKLHKSAQDLDWKRDAHYLERKIRAHTPWPGSSILCPDPLSYRLKIHQASITTLEKNYPPGMLLRKNNHLVLTTSHQALILEKVQPPNKNILSGQLWAQSLRNTEFPWQLSTS